MKSRSFWLLIMVLLSVSGLLALFQSRAQASGWWRCVNPGGTNGCYASIQAAINDSSFGDSINVGAGTYMEHISLKDGVSIYGAGWDTTIINGSHSSSLSTVTAVSTVGPSTLLANVQVTGGGTGDPNTSADGGGIWMVGSPTISNTWVNDNTGYWGGGLAIWGGSPTLFNISVSNNKGVLGGGLYFANNAVVTVTSDFNGMNGTVYFNRADVAGGGIYVGNGATATIGGLRVYLNSAGAGGGIAVFSSHPVMLTLNDILFNAADANGDGGGLEAMDSPNLQVIFNRFGGNSAHNGGGAILLRSAGRFANNWLIGNTVSNTNGMGGGLYVNAVSNGVTVEGNWVEANSAFSGGGIALGPNAKAEVNANVVVTNTAYGSGGAGIYVNAMTPLSITNNIIARNVITPDINVSAGAGIDIVATPARIINNTIADNQGDGLCFYTSNNIVVADNIIYGNASHGIYAVMPGAYTVNYNDVSANAVNYQWVTPGTNDLSRNPLFAGTGDLKAFYHLQPTSPVYNTGSLAFAPPFDIDGEARMLCASMGADQINCARLHLPLIIR